MYRPEHPKPQFERGSWENLNGSWEFSFDPSDSGVARAQFKNDAAFPLAIEVPFCPESELSGIGEKDFLSSVWYRRTVTLSASQLSGRVVLHFGAVDYLATLYVNEQLVGSHKGGYVSFSFDITDYVQEGQNTIVLHAEDDTRSGMIPSGKQSEKYASYGCFYTRTTGIWQTVWLEFTPKTYIQKFRLTPEPSTSTLYINADLYADPAAAGTSSLRFSVQAFYEGKPVGEASALSCGGPLHLALPLSEKHLWEPGQGRLYDLILTYGEDVVKSYFGLRSARFADRKFLLNERSVFMRTVLDQGFNPQGIYTAPSDEFLAADIDLSMAMGFNGARLHEKVFEERFLYYCDKKGYFVWGEYPSWGLDHTDPLALYSILPEWLEEIDRDYNHPSIIGWCPFNETWDLNGHVQYDPLLACIYKATKAADPTRPCIDTSGNFHVLTDVFDLHNYTQDPEEFRAHFAEFARTGKCGGPHVHEDRQPYDPKLPFFLSEYGGIRWTKDLSGWGYGDAPRSEEEFLSRLKGLTDVLLDNPAICGLCYTQLTDVEQEQNGLYTYDRQAKFPAEVISPIFRRKAAIEE